MSWPIIEELLVRKSKKPMIDLGVIDFIHVDAKSTSRLSESIDLGSVMRCGHLIYLRKLEIIKVSW